MQLLPLHFSHANSTGYLPPSHSLANTKAQLETKAAKQSVEQLVTPFVCNLIINIESSIMTPPLNGLHAFALDELAERE